MTGLYHLPRLLSPPSHPLASSNAFFLPKQSLSISRIHYPALFCTLQTDEILRLVTEPNDNTLPCFRTFENDSSRLSLFGSVSYHQALTAAAADGGRSADDHIRSGAPVMVVETVFPGPGDDHATVSTRLFLPAKKVKEKARKLRSSLKEDVLSVSTPQNILAMTFRQVVLQQLWNFELVVFSPGSMRNMEDPENPREVSFRLSASDEKVTSLLTEGICAAALQNTESHFLGDRLGETSSHYFKWFQTPNRVVSGDSAVTIYKLSDNEIIENAKNLLETFNLAKKRYNGLKMRDKYTWWVPEAHYKLENIGGPEFSSWAREYVPAYRMQINADNFKHVKFEGWRKAAENTWEVLLTHTQMVGLAEILDMFYEDTYTLPHKDLSCGVVTKFVRLSNKKSNTSLLNTLSLGLASGVFLFIASVLSQFCFPHLRNGFKYPQETRPVTSDKIRYPVNEALDDAKLQELCVLVIKKIKDAFGWPCEIITESSNGAWIGELPQYLKITLEADSSGVEDLIDWDSIQEIGEDMKSSAQSIASYQVVLSTEGKIVGFQPTSRLGVNHWASNPLTNELYGGRKLAPGFIERGLEIRLPDEVVVIELLMSVNSDAYFAMAMPVR